MKSLVMSDAHVFMTQILMASRSRGGQPDDSCKLKSA